MIRRTRWTIMYSICSRIIHHPRKSVACFSLKNIFTKIETKVLLILCLVLIFMKYAQFYSHCYTTWGEYDCIEVKFNSRLQMSNDSKWNYDVPPSIGPGVLLESRHTTAYSHPCLPNALSPDEKLKSYELFYYIAKLFTDSNIQFFLNQGSLLGSYVFHDFIPWDDDLDITVPLKDVNKIRALLRNDAISKVLGVGRYPMSGLDKVNTYSMPYLQEDLPLDRGNSCLGAIPIDDCHHNLQIFFKNSSRTLWRGWLRFPYIDIIIFDENDTHIWVFNPRDNFWILQKGVVYPLHLRPFGPIWLPAPRDMVTVIAEQFQHDFKCSSLWYSHKTQMISLGRNVPCNKLAKCYAMVTRRKTEHKTKPVYCYEHLTQDGKLIHRIRVEENCLNTKKTLLSLKP